ncbi:hypothetical protein CRYUN_Cryun25bG0048500 [Craigia yunnanensis]
MKVPDLEKILVAKDVFGVFPEELPGLPLVKEIEFGIDVPQINNQKSISPYSMALLELKELKIWL